MLNVMSPPAVPVIPSEREVDLVVVHSLPQTGIKEFKHVSIDLKDPELQTITQTFEDETGLGTGPYLDLRAYPAIQHRAG